MRRPILVIVVLSIVIVSLGFVFINKAQATPLVGIKIEVCKYGLFSKLFGDCFEYEVQPSYDTSSIWCYSSNTIREGWTCEDNNGDNFDILYGAINVRNMNSQNIEIVRHRLEYGHNMTYSDLVEPDKKGFVFHQEDYAFSIHFIGD